MIVNLNDMALLLGQKDIEIVSLKSKIKELESKLQKLDPNLDFSDEGVRLLQKEA